VNDSQLAIDGGRPVRENFLVFGSPDIRDEEIREVEATMRSGWIGTGPRVGRFEEMFREYVGCRHAVAVSSCTAALHLSMIAAGVRAGDDVITTPMTFAATANAAIHLGARPVLVDIDRRTMNINPSLIESAVTPHTKAIVPVHFAGRACDMDPILETGRRHGLAVIEDAAHAVETSYRGRKVGAIGDLTCFSFYVTKNVVTGEGGMVTTEDEEKASWIKTGALHGLSKDAWKRYSDEGFRHYQVLFPGFKYNMMDLQAAIGIHQLGRVVENHHRRRLLWSRFLEAFADLPVDLPAPEEPDTVHARHLFTLLLRLEELTADRDRVMQALHAEGIGTGIHYVALHLHSYYARTYGWRRGMFPEAEWVSDRTISLPFSTRLTEQDAGDVIAAVRKVLRRYAR
jgi:dTDP-4-amino-4,6-dideoxygalactose transaminase